MEAPQTPGFSEPAGLRSARRPRPTDKLNVGKTPGGGSALAGRGVDMYVSELLGYSLDRLRKEPEILREETERIDRAIQSNSVSNYSAFIKAAACLQTVNNELSTVSRQLGSLLQVTPQLAAACEQFSSQSATVMEQYASNKQLASQQAALLEVLEVPQLMDTCVRNGIYDEALDLQAFVSRMALLHPDVPVVRTLAAQVQQDVSAMLDQLRARLRSNLQLPECLRIIGYLRRVSAYSEAQLRLEFLTCRDAWIAGLIDELDESDSYEYVKQLTDVHRLHLFDVVMQYRAIFFDAPPTTAAGPDDAGAAAAAMASAQQRFHDSASLYSWVQRRVSLYLDALRRHLPAVTDGGNLASALEHCVYAGASISRVGCDFQKLLQPVFEACSLGLFSAQLSAAVEAFSHRLDGHKWVPMPAPAVAKAAAAAAAGAGGGADAAAGSGAGASQQDLSPPPVVMEHLPLAVFTNGVLAALNELRHCTLSSMAQPMAQLLEAACEQVASGLVHYRHTHVVAPNELPLFRSAAKTYAEVVVPYVAACFARVFPAAGAAAAAAGGPAARVDTSQALATVRELLTQLG